MKAAESREATGSLIGADSDFEPGVVFTGTNEFCRVNACTHTAAPAENVCTSTTVTNGAARLAASLLFLAAIASVNAGEYDGRKDFDIGAQSLESALIEFSEQSDLQLLIATEYVRDLDSKGVKGRYLPEDALSILIDGTDLTFQAIGDDTVSVSPSTGDRAGHRKAPKDVPLDGGESEQCAEKGADSSEDVASIGAECES